MRLRSFILCFNRTAISIQKIDSKSSKSHLKLFSRISSKSYRHNAVSNRFLSRFSTSLTNAPRLLSQAKWVHTRLSEKDRTQRLTRRNKSLPSPGHSTVLCRQRNPFCSATLLYTYISRFTVNPHYISRGRKSGKVAVTVLSQTTSRRAFQLLPQTAHVCFHSRKRVHTRLSEKNRTQGHTRRNRGVSDGGGITTLGALCTLLKRSAPACQKGYRMISVFSGS